MNQSLSITVMTRTSSTTEKNTALFINNSLGSVFVIVTYYGVCYL